MNIAIIDIIGIPYDGNTVFTRGLGGSESAVTLVSIELAKLGFNVTVFNNCDIDHATPGVYNNVTYRPLSELSYSLQFDIVISSRTVIPFLTNEQFSQVGDSRAAQFANMDLYNRILANAKQRILWMHDTFCLGDNLIETLAVTNRITDIFTLSDWHLSYVTSCHHGRRRNFEVLKRKMFITRNGANLYHKEVNITAKDPNQFVYNASVTKGMIPLVKHIWPRIKQQIPAAKLTVIGGYYKFSANSQPDQQELDWRAMAANPANSSMGIEFTGIISQKEIADRLSNASFTIYPAAFPETYGISTLESLLYNTPVITCRFGALEEIALDNACYLLDYAIEPNGLFPDINMQDQIDKFVNLTVQAYHDKYLHQQKQYYCNIIKDISSWSSIALQWKQLFYKKTGQYLSRNEYRAVSKINHRLHKIYDRRYHNSVELESYKSNSEQMINIVTAFYNCETYIARCIESIAAQDYDNYTCYLINDASTDNTDKVVLDALLTLPNDIRSKFVYVCNTVNQGAVKNHIDTIRPLDANSIIMLLDGDDSLVNDNTILSFYNTVYDNVEFTYGSCWSMADNIPLISQPYPEEVKQAGTYRTHKFNWGMPYTHLRTFKKHLIDNIADDEFKDVDGNWFRAGGDNATFYALIEQADPAKVKCLQDIVYNYNDINPLNDYKINAAEQTATANKITNKMPPTKKKILIAIPTSRNIEAATFKSIYDQIVPDDCETTFQFFYGYNVDQVRNLIADWTVKGYDYLWAVDSDMAFPSDTLVKLLSHDVDVVSAIYRQRKQQQVLEIYETDVRGSIVHMPYYKLQGKGLTRISGCGFGCVLVKAEVLRSIGYPQFKYHAALDHAHTVSEDIDFCHKAQTKGFQIWVDPSIQCEHIGAASFYVQEEQDLTIPNRLRELSNQQLLPKTHIEFLKTLSIQPKVVYDIGACVLHWTNEAARIWNQAEFIAFEAMPEVEFLYKEAGLRYHIGVLSDISGKTVEFYQNTLQPGGNSYYRENIEVNPVAHEMFNDDHKRSYTTVTLDTVVNLKNLPAPDLIKMDVQGAELDVLKGAEQTLQTCNHVILELQEVEYNKGAPLKDVVISYMDSIGFVNLGMFNKNGPDGDYYFKRKQQ